MRFPLSEMILAVLAALPLMTLADDSLSPEKRQVIDQVDALEGEISRMSQTLWDYSEIALEETESAGFLARAIELADRHDFVVASDEC